MAMNDPNINERILDLRQWTGYHSGALLPKMSIKRMIKNREMGKRERLISHHVARRGERSRSYHTLPISNISGAFTFSEEANLINRFLPNKWTMITSTDSELFRCLHLSDEGFVTLSHDKMLRFYAHNRSEYELRNELRLPNVDGLVTDLTCSTRGDQLAYSTTNAYDDEHLITGGAGGYFSAHHSDVKAIYCSKTNPYLFYTGSVDGCCKLWDGRVLNNDPIAISTGNRYSINHFDGDIYDRYIVTTSLGDAIDIWDLRRFSENLPFNQQQQNQNDETEHFDTALKIRGRILLEIFWRAKFSPERTGHRYIYCGSDSGRVYIFDIMTGGIVREFQKCRKEIHDCSWNPNDNEIISVSLCGTTARWYYQE